MKRAHAADRIDPMEREAVCRHVARTRVATNAKQLEDDLRAQGHGVQVRRAS